MALENLPGVVLLQVLHIKVLVSVGNGVNFSKMNRNGQANLLLLCTTGGLSSVYMKQQGAARHYQSCLVNHGTEGNGTELELHFVPGGTGTFKIRGTE